MRSVMRRRPSGSSKSPIMTRAPSVTNKRASAAPCPRAPPLMSMIFPLRRSGCAAKTLRRHFRDELDRGVVEANATISGSLFGAAKGGNVWSSGSRISPTVFPPPAAPPYMQMSAAFAETRSAVLVAPKSLSWQVATLFTRRPSRR